MKTESVRIKRDELSVERPKAKADTDEKEKRSPLGDLGVERLYTFDR
ncbi:MAG: hypothetical protein WBP41_16370 [Saprospiraceae bacterium]